MARRSLKDLKKHLKEQENSKGNNNGTGGFFYPFWRLPFDGSTRIRVLEDPDQDNPMIVYKEWLEHKLDIGDEKVTIPCPKNEGKTVPCPICELSAKLYDADNKKRGKYYYRDSFLVLRGIVIKDGLEYDEDEDNAEGQVKVFKMTFQLANKFKTEMGKLDDDEYFWELDGGLDFEIVKSKQRGDNGEEWGKYDLASGFVRKNTDVPEEMRENLPEDDLTSIFHAIPSYDEAHEILQKHLRDVSGHGDSDDEDDDNTESEEELMEKLNRNKAEKKKKKEKKEEKKAKKEDDDDDLDEDVTIFDNDDDNDDDVDDLMSLLDDDDDDD